MVSVAKSSLGVFKPALVLLLVVFLSGCSIQETAGSSVDSESQQNAPSNNDPDDASSDDESPGGDQPETSEPESTEPELVQCSQTEQSGIERTINAQTGYFAVGDFELAYSYASESFRSSVSLERFIQIIEGSYGPLISSSTLSFSNCLVNREASVAAIDARFSEDGTELYALRYVLVESDLGWRVDGASGLQSAGSGT